MTDPAYFGKLRNITESYKLYEYNEEDPEEAAAPEAGTRKQQKPNRSSTRNRTGRRSLRSSTRRTNSRTRPNSRANRRRPGKEDPDGSEVYIAFPMTNFKIGSKGNYVKMIQEKINHGLKVDGNYGSITAAFVTVYQSKIIYDLTGS